MVLSLERTYNSSDLIIRQCRQYTSIDEIVDKNCQKNTIYN